MKLALLGGGGFRTPLTLAALRHAAPRLDLHEVVLHDVDPGRLQTMRRVVEASSATDRQAKLKISATTDLHSALRDASSVLCAIRVGGLAARAVDERLALDAGLVGQETVGAGGLCLLMRSVSVISSIAREIARVAPGAWVVNFTNPVGAISGLLREELGNRVIGVCDTPADLASRVAAVIGREVDALRFDYFGLNHLGWLRGVYDQNEHDLLPGLLADSARLEQLDEARLLGGERLRALGLLPIEYLAYYYFPERHVGAVAAAGRSRGEFLLRQQADFYAAAATNGSDAASLWQASRAERDGSYLSDTGAEQASRTIATANEGYAGVAVAVLAALAANAPARAIVDVANGATLGFLPPEATVEVPCTVDAEGAAPARVEEVPEHARALMVQVYQAEQRAIEAVRTRSRPAALAALAAHPLVASTDRAERVLDAYLREQPELAEQLT